MKIAFGRDGLCMCKIPIQRLIRVYCMPIYIRESPFVGVEIPRDLQGRG